jgi:hypothetical protein
MKLTQDQCMTVVTEASQRMAKDADYSATLVGNFVQYQVQTVQFISAHESELGGAESIVSVIFHCALVAECFHRAGAKIRELTFEDLDVAARSEVLKKLEEAQLPLHEFIQANVEHEEAKRLIAIVALAIDHIVP